MDWLILAAAIAALYGLYRLAKWLDARYWE